MERIVSLSGCPEFGTEKGALVETIARFLALVRSIADVIALPRATPREKIDPWCPSGLSRRGTRVPRRGPDGPERLPGHLQALRSRQPRGSLQLSHGSPGAGIIGAAAAGAGSLGRAVGKAQGRGRGRDGG